MPMEEPARDGAPSGLSRLVAPHPSITGESARQKARLTAGLLLALAALSALTLFVPTMEPGTLWPPTDRWLVGILLVVMSGAYALAKSGRPTAALVIAIAAMEAGTWSSRWVAGAEGHGEPTLIFLVLPVLLAGVLLPLRWAAAVAAGTVAVAWVLESVADQRFGRTLDSEDVALALLLLGVGVLAVVSSALADDQARRLAASASLLRQVTENLPEVLFVVAADGSRMHYTNPAYETVTGRTIAQAMADPLDWLKPVHPEDLPRVRAELAAGRPDLEYRLVHPSGQVKHVRARTFPVLDAGGKPTRIVGMAEDVTAAREAERIRHEAQQQRIRLLQQLAHDMGTPLTPIKLQLRILQDRVGADGRESLAVLKRNADHLQRLVQDVGDLARLEGGVLRLDRRPVDLSALVRQAVESLAPSAAERGVALTAEPDGPLPAEADAGRVTQVLYNLVGNALKFTPRGGTVTVRAQREDGMARIDVSDTGAGLRPDQMARLFRAFEQVHDPATVKRAEDRGSGLGLNISKGLVEAHGGAIGVSSDGPGKGSTFTFRLPLAG